MSNTNYPFPVYISAYSRSSDGDKRASLFLDTIRVGFPTARIYVECSLACDDNEFMERCHKLNLFITPLKIHNHGLWHETLFGVNQTPYIICDTDMVFFDSMEEVLPADLANQELGMVGRYIPEFYDPMLKCIHSARLHTSLMYINPMVFKNMLDKVWPDSREIYTYTPLASLIKPQVIFFNQRPMFFDCFAHACHVGVPFAILQDAALNRYEHLMCGAWLEDAVRRLPTNLGEQLTKCHELALADKNSIRGLWKAQDEYYKSLCPTNETTNNTNEL
jgi:hypothetical protein